MKIKIKGEFWNKDKKQIIQKIDWILTLFLSLYLGNILYFIIIDLNILMLILNTIAIISIIIIQQSIKTYNQEEEKNDTNN